MATLGTKLSLNIAAGGLTSNALALSINKNLTVQEGGVRVIEVNATSVGSSASAIYTPTSSNPTTKPVYLYLKNLDATATDYIYVYADTASDDPVIFQLAGGEFLFAPLEDATTFKAYATTTGTLLEVGVFGTDQLG